MITISFAYNVFGWPTAALFHFEFLQRDPTLATSNASMVTFTEGVRAYTLHGTNLSFTEISGKTVLTGGTITGIDVYGNGNYLMSLSTMSVDVTSYRAALLAEEGGDISALETLFMSYAIDYRGSVNPDTFRGDETSFDGVPLRFDHDDIVRLNEFHDTFALGKGNDIAWGGFGRDTIRGENGDDTIFGEGDQDRLAGGPGNDRLIGGPDSDRLGGGSGNDTLNGGSGNDVLRGGKGSDKLRGGADADTFVFGRANWANSEATHGHDRIMDFEDGVDRIRLFGSAEGITIEAAGNGVLVDYGRGTIKVDGMTTETLTLEDFLFV